jgi:hypothetical protein
MSVYISRAVSMDSNDRYCLSFFENLELVIGNSDAAREVYIVVERIPDIFGYYIVIRFRGYGISFACLDHRTAEVKIFGRDINNRIVLNTKQEMKQFQKDLLTLINIVRYSMKIREIIAKKRRSKNHSTLSETSIYKKSKDNNHIALMLITF